MKLTYISSLCTVNAIKARIVHDRRQKTETAILKKSLTGFLVAFPFTQLSQSGRQTLPL